MTLSFGNKIRTSKIRKEEDEEGTYRVFYGDSVKAFYNLKKKKKECTSCTVQQRPPHKC